MLEVLFSFLVHTISGGLSRVASAMSSSPNRSRSPLRNNGNTPDDKAEVPKENPVVPVSVVPPPNLPDAPAEGEVKEGTQGVVATPAEEAAGKQLIEAVISASQSLTICAQELEKNCNLLSDVKDSAAAMESLAAGVNYYASTTKAANSSQAQAHKQIQWDWLSSANERTPMKEIIKNIKQHCENTGKASFEVVKTSQQIVDLIQKNNQLMKDQCQMLQVIGENQQKLAEIMQGVVEPPQAVVPPTGGGWQWTWWNLTTCSGLHAMFPTWYCASYAIDASDAAADSDSCEVLAVSTCGSTQHGTERKPQSTKRSLCCSGGSC